MTLEIVVAAIGGFAGGALLGLCLYLWWRIRTWDKRLYEVCWDLFVVAQRLQRLEEHETPEPPRH
jgi:hypothetical protein